MTNIGRGEPKRSLTPANAWAIAFGCIVGWGAFVMPGTLFLPQAGPLGTLAAMLIGVGVMALFGFNYAYMMNRLPGEGGAYSYAREAFGRDHAFVCAWLLCFSYLVIIPLNASSLTTIGRQIFHSVLRVGAHYRVAGYDVYLWEVLVVQGTVLLLGLISLLRKSWLRMAQTVLAVTIVASVTVLFLAAAVKGQLWHVRPLFGSARDSGGMLAVVLLTPWAFVGFDTLSWSTREFRFPTKSSFRIMCAAILLSGCTYAALTWLTACAVPAGYSSWRSYIQALDMYDGLAAMPTFYAARSLLGDAGVALMFTAAAAAVLTTILGFFRAVRHILPALAEDGALPRRFTRESFATAFVIGVSVLLPLLGQVALGWLMDMSALCAIAGFGYTSAAACFLARQQGSDDIRMTGAAGLAISLLLAILQLVPALLPTGSIQGGAFAVLLVWCLLGWALFRRPALPEGGAHPAAARVLLLCIAAFCAALWVQRSFF